MPKQTVLLLIMWSAAKHMLAHLVLALINCHGFISLLCSHKKLALRTKSRCNQASKKCALSGPCWPWSSCYCTCNKPLKFSDQVINESFSMPLDSLIWPAPVTNQFDWQWCSSTWSYITLKDQTNSELQYWQYGKQCFIFSFLLNSSLALHHDLTL